MTKYFSNSRLSWQKSKKVAKVGETVDDILIKEKSLSQRVSEIIMLEL